MKCLGGKIMIALFSFSWSGRPVPSGGGKRQLRGRPALEALEDRTLLSFWTTVTPMPTARGELVAVTASDAQIYAIAGNNTARTALATVEAYNTDTMTWSTRASLNTARISPGGAGGNDGRIYVMGGLTDFTSRTPINTLEQYNPFQNRWIVMANLPTPRAG